MECPFCGKIDTGVIDSRPTKERVAIRRRRQCLACAGRFTTYESTPEQLMLLLMRQYAGRSASARSPEAVLSFMSSALRSLSEEIEKLVVEVDKPGPPKKAKKAGKKLAAKRVPKKKAPARRKVAATKPKKVAAKKEKKMTDTAQVLKVIKGHKKGANIQKLKQRTGFADSKIRAIVQRAYKRGRIKRLGRGVYVMA
ncbi:MAG: hypothetical protein PVF76_17520 [Syntrophobacterales bacterium]